MPSPSHSSFLVLLPLLFSASLLPSSVHSHGYLLVPPARNGVTGGSLFNPSGKNPGLSSLTDAIRNTCGTALVPDPGVQPITEQWVAGQVVQIQWNNTLVHGGPPGVRLAVQYSPTDQFNANVLFDGLDVGVNGVNQVTILLPADKSSPNAIFQWIWSSASDNGFYMGCSDVAIKAAVAGQVAPIALAPLNAGEVVNIITPPAGTFTPTAADIAAAQAAAAGTATPAPAAPAAAVPPAATPPVLAPTPLAASATAAVAPAAALPAAALPAAALPAAALPAVAPPVIAPTPLAASATAAVAPAAALPPAALPVIAPTPLPMSATGAPAPASVAASVTATVTPAVPAVTDPASAAPAAKSTVNASARQAAAPIITAVGAMIMGFVARLW